MQLHRRLIQWIIFLILWSAGATAQAVEIGGEVYFIYYYVLPTFDGRYDPRAATNDFSAFDITRARLDLSGSPSPQWSAHLATDVERVHNYEADVDNDGEMETVDTPDAGRFTLVLRYAEIIWQPLDYLGIDAGIIETPWIGYVDRANGLRFVDQLLDERVGWNGNLTDLGVALVGQWPGGFGDYRIQVSNGGGTDHFETNREKAAEGRFTFIPAFGSGSWSNLSFSLGGRYNTVDNPPGNEINRDVVGRGLLHYGGPLLNLGLESSLDANWAEERAKPSFYGLASTAWTSVHIGELFEPFVRIERYDPTIRDVAAPREGSRIDGDPLAADADGYWRALAGLALHPASKVQAAFAGRIRWFDEQYDVGPRTGDNIAPEIDLRACLAFEL